MSGMVGSKEEFVDIGPPEVVAKYEVQPGIYESHVFIPAKLADNLILEKRDPGYRRRLESQPGIVKGSCWMAIGTHTQGNTSLSSVGVSM